MTNEKGEADQGCQVREGLNTGLWSPRPSLPTPSNRQKTHPLKTANGLTMGCGSSLLTDAPPTVLCGALGSKLV